MLSVMCQRVTLVTLALVIVQTMNIQCNSLSPKIKTCKDFFTGPGALTASRGPGLTVTCNSPMPPVGISLTSENACDGVLAVIGLLPFLGLVTVDGRLLSLGYGGVSYASGRGNVVISGKNLRRKPNGLKGYKKKRRDVTFDMDSSGL